MMKCVLVGDKRYLMADLEEECFANRHMSHLLAFTAPQLILVVLGLPILGTLVILRKNNFTEHFRIRYGLLYLGYRDGREWWEVIIAFRKVLIVIIGTLGTVMGAVDLQAFLAMLVIFGALLLHLTGKPFDTSKPKLNLLHQLEVAALSLCWLTFWGGMLFYLGHEQPEIIQPWVKITMSILIVSVNTLFLIFASYEFVKEFINDYKHKADVRRKTLLNMTKQEVKLKSMKSMVLKHRQQERKEKNKHSKKIVPVHNDGLGDVGGLESNGEGGQGSALRSWE
jgi:hypothetical protein